MRAIHQSCYYEGGTELPKLGDIIRNDGVHYEVTGIEDDLELDIITINIRAVDNLNAKGYISIGLYAISFELLHRADELIDEDPLP